MSLLEVHALSKTYARSDRAAVHDVSLTVTQGEFVSLVGESGSGKTTLLRLIAGLEVADEGTIRLGGVELSHTDWHMPPEKRGVGMVFQHHALFPHLTVAKNISFGLRHLSQGKRNDKVTEMLDLVGLPGYAQRYPHELSGGERQRIALARALATEPGVLLLDEPFSSLDPCLRQALRDETRRVLKKHGTTAILVTHHTNDALAISDRIAVMNKGHLEQYDSPETIYHRPVNEHVASLFGPCNPLPESLMKSPSERGQLQWLRPDELVLAPLNHERVKLTGRVSQVTYGGGCQDVTLHCEENGKLPFMVTVCHRAGWRVSEGEEWGVVRKERD